ncbi:MAG: 1-acyl-sn-glycerol-3-phosphate acyltransferase [Bacteroidia bacterium]|nr:1-acyl-sn-glycerol-3-phosphate acyltransferase [Bacteroidia bacterium]
MIWIFRLLFRLKGWKVNQKNLPAGVNKCVMVAAPHTSNWDTIFMTAAFSILKIPLKFAIKKEWMVFPVGGLFRALGGIGIDRSPKVPGQDRKSYVEAMAELFEGRKDLVIAVSPEGTRKLVEKWKTGFYWVAMTAKVPIGLGYLDYATKTAGVAELFHPTGNFNQDMEHIVSVYAPYKGKFPENFRADFERKAD